MGRVSSPLGLEPLGLAEIAAPNVPPLDPARPQISRGRGTCLAGRMPGAIALAATRARAGAAMCG